MDHNSLQNLYGTQNGSNEFFDLNLIDFEDVLDDLNFIESDSLQFTDESGIIICNNDKDLFLSGIKRKEVDDDNIMNSFNDMDDINCFDKVSNNNDVSIVINIEKNEPKKKATKSNKRNRVAILTENPLYSFYPNIIKAFNVSNLEVIKTMINNYAAIDCKVQYITPTMNKEMVGRENILVLFELPMNVYPDGVVVIKDFNVKDSEALGVYNYNYIYSGTKAFEDSKFEKVLRSKDKESFADMMDKSTHSGNELTTIRNVEKAIKSARNLVLVYIQGVVTVIVDKSKGKVSNFIQNWKVTSFRSAPSVGPGKLD